ncbi:MAG: helix-turn-helix transcriptional regulator [Actinobacteria bacterium]|nr:helix-turn-helix transcriptional regulator [Actinomycetota bacterium]
MPNINEDDFRSSLGASLRSFRENGGFTLEQLAQRLGVDQANLSRMERGERNLSTLVLRRAADVFGVRMDAFFNAPGEAVELLRAGDDARTDVILDWAAELQRDMRAVRALNEDERV